MQEYLEKLREKPAHVRKTIAASVTAFITLVIVVVWLSFWAPGRAPKETSLNAATPVALATDNWQGLKNAFSDSFSEMKNQFRF